jgi:hypothetical protein
VPERTLDAEFLIGNWRRDQASRIRIDGAGLRACAPTVSAPGRPAAINEGGFRAEFRPGTSPCRPPRRRLRHELERRGPYLLANDNARCGGHNVRFVGIYLRRAARCAPAPAAAAPCPGFLPGAPV